MAAVLDEQVASLIFVEISSTMHSVYTGTSSCLEGGLLSFLDARYQGSQPHALRGVIVGFSSAWMNAVAKSVPVSSSIS